MKFVLLISLFSLVVSSEGADLRERRTSSERKLTFCEQQHGSGVSVVSIAECNKIKCSTGDITKEYDIFYYNFCPTGQICQAGSCVDLAAKKQVDTNPNSWRPKQMKYQRAECDKKVLNNIKYRPVCFTSNIRMHPSYETKCEGDMCAKLYCAVNTHGQGFRVDEFTLPEGTACADNKVCKSNACSSP